MIVVDATVLVDFMVGNEPLKAAASQLMKEDSRWISPGLWRYEVGNALRGMARQKNADPQVLAEALRTASLFLEESVEAVRCETIWEISMESGLTFYDASYVWLARDRGLELRTRDAQILRKCSDVARPMPSMG